jgi:hypothetical protein
MPYYKFAPQTGRIWQFFPGKLKSDRTFLKSSVCVPHVRKAADETKITIFSDPSERRK